jgi:hypothetical protein
MSSVMYRWAKAVRRPYDTGVRDPHSDESWNKLLRRAAVVLLDIRKKHGVRVQWEADTNYVIGHKHGFDPAQLDAKAIRFNGIDKDGADTFMLTRGGKTDYQGSWHCDTQGKPYDLAVQAVLLIAREEIDLDVRSIDSDIDGDEWQAARDIVAAAKRRKAETE